MRFWGFLMLLGIGWGVTMPFTKLAVSGGMIFWQSVVMVVILGTIALIRRKGLVCGRPQIAVYSVIAMIGTVLPNAASFTAYVHLDAGIMAILISLVPIFALPVALVLGLERLQLKRLLGLVLGLFGILLLILPGQKAIGAVSLWWIPVGLIPSLLYAFEGNLVSRFGTAGLDALQAFLLLLGICTSPFLINQ